MYMCYVAAAGINGCKCAFQNVGKMFQACANYDMSKKYPVFRLTSHVYNK